MRSAETKTHRHPCSVSGPRKGDPTVPLSVISVPASFDSIKTQRIPSCYRALSTSYIRHKPHCHVFLRFATSGGSGPVRQFQFRARSPQPDRVRAVAFSFLPRTGLLFGGAGHAFKSKQ